MKRINISKNKIATLIVSLLVLLISGCSDFLSVPSNEQPDAGNTYKTAKQAEQGVLGVYSDLRFLSNDLYLYMSECRSDNAWVAPTTDGFREYSEIGTFRATYELTAFNDVWNTLYKVIYDANVAITKIPAIEFAKEEIKEQFLGEVYFLRAWAYFELVRLYGNVPLIDRPMFPAEVHTVSQSTAKEIYDKIIVPDLIAAETKLPVTSAMKTSNNQSATAQGRADQVAAKAMLGRVYMTMAGFPLNDSQAQDKAENKLKEVIDFADQNNKYWAKDSTEWKKQWMAENNNKYSIFAIQHRSGGTGNPAVFNFSPALPPTYTTIRIFGNNIFVEKSLMYEFIKKHQNGNTDARGIGTSVLNGYDTEPNFPAYPNTTDFVNIEGVGKVEVYTQSMIYKYNNSLRKRASLGYPQSFESTMKDYNDWPVNYSVIRLEDVMLMYAEILLNKHARINDAMTIVNKIRSRAGCDPINANSVTEAMKAVKNERRIELFGEGVRWFDMIRWGDWQKNIVDMFQRYNNPVGADPANVKAGRYLFPIPKNAMTIKPGLYIQNTDY